MAPHMYVVCPGGGRGAPTVMVGMRVHTGDIAGIIAVTDSGRSSGTVRFVLEQRRPRLRAIQ